MFGSVAIAHDLLLEIGSFRPEMGLCHDLELAMRVAAYGNVAYIDEPLLDYTVREDSTTAHLMALHMGRGSAMVQFGAAWLSALQAHEARRVVALRSAREASAKRVRNAQCEYTRDRLRINKNVHYTRREMRRNGNVAVSV